MDDVNVSMAEVVLNDVDDLMKKAFVTAKGQKTLIKQLATDRKDDVVKDCSDSVALLAVTSQTFLATPDGRKIARDLMIRLGFERVWEAVRVFIKQHKPSRFHCHYIGQTFQMAWKKLHKIEAEFEGPEEDAPKGRLSLEQDVFEQLFRLAIVTEKKWSDRFINIIEGLAADRTTTVDHMLYRTSAPILWQAVAAPNGQCRFNGTVVFFKLYPLNEGPEAQLDFDLRHRQYETILKMLKDDCYAVRVEAVKAVLDNLAKLWPVYKAVHRKDYITYIFDTLAKDDCNEVRLAIYQTLPALFACGQAKAVVQHAVKMVALSGINESVDKLRRAALKMLLEASKCGVAIESVVNVVEVVTALEVETVDVLQKAFVKLLVPYFCAESAASGKERAKKIVELCHMSRIGALRFHVEIFSLHLISVQNVFHHIRSLIVYMKHKIGKNRDLDSTEATAMDETRSGVDFSLLKTLFDCCIVLYVAARKELATDENKEHEAAIWKLFQNFIKHLLDGQLRQTMLAESALYADSLLPPEMGEPAAVVMRRLAKLDLADGNLLIYVMQASARDYGELMNLVEDGLYSFAKEVGVDKQLPRRMTQLATTGVTDKTKDRHRKAVAFLHVVLNNPTPRKPFFTKYAFAAKKFHIILEILVNSMPKLAGNDQEDLWTAIYDVYTALAIGIASEKAADNPEFADDENSRPSTSEPFEKACRWFLPRLERGHLTSDFVSKFVSLATCHLECSPLREASCNVVAELGERLKAYADEHLDGEAEAAMRKKLANMNKAGIEAIKYCIAEPGLQVVHEGDEEGEEVVEAGMRTAVEMEVDEMEA